MTTTKAPKLAEIARRIHEHLSQWEIEQKTDGDGRRPGEVFSPSAWVAGNHIGVKYVSYRKTWMISKAEAIQYLAWLDAGNRGTHRTALLRETP